MLEFAACLVGKVWQQEDIQKGMRTIVNAEAGTGVAEAQEERKRLEQARAARLGPHLSAARALEDALKSNPNDARLLTSLGYSYSSAQEYGLAADVFEKILAVDPSIYAAKIGLGESYMHLGEIAKAARIFENLLNSGVRNLKICRPLSQIPQSFLSVDVLKVLDSMNAPQSGKGAVAHAFVKATVLHKAKRYREAWELMIAANSLKKEGLENEHPYPSEIFTDDLDRLRDCKPLRGREIEKGIPTSLFILGPSRSGKTTMERLVGSLNGVKRGFENPIFLDVESAFQTAARANDENIEDTSSDMPAMFRELYVSFLLERAGKASIFTNTAPQLITKVSKIAMSIPNYRFIFLKREIDDVVIRIFMKHYKKSTNSYAYSIDSIYAFVRWYFDMIDVIAELLPDTSRVIHYEEMVEDPKATLDIAADLCGVPSQDRELPQIGDDRGCAAPYKEFMAAARN